MDFEHLREAMVRDQIAARGIRDQRVLQAFRTVPREAFLPADLRKYAYEDGPLPIGEDQTISQPYIVALMIEALNLGPSSRVLDVGTGSGYAAAVLSRIAAEVYSIERVGVLAVQAEQALARLGYDNIHIVQGDGSLGWPDHAPYDGIVVAAGSPDIPQALVDQLAGDACLVLPVGDSARLQELLRLCRSVTGEVTRESLGGVRFVPLIGEKGWRNGDGRPLGGT